MESFSATHWVILFVLLVLFLAFIRMAYNTFRWLFNLIAGKKTD
jgi:cytochrome b subunit of formate dehydrogenase